MDLLKEFEERQKTRESFLEWVRKCGYEPAAHHILLINELETLVKKMKREMEKGSKGGGGGGLRLMVLMPPGSAKSTYISKLFPPWFFAQVKGKGILACSHEAGLAGDFGRAARNLIESNERWLGYRLSKDSRAVDKWETEDGNYYQAAGVGSGIAGRRAHLGVIDDFCGSEEEAGSKLFNDRVWLWYENDFVNRLQPNAARVIIANHRNEDDLIGRLLKLEPEKWKVIRLRLIIETEEQAEQDPLGRKVGEYLWPEYFTRAVVEERMRNPRASGIQQQDPSPETGDFFRTDHFRYYDELPNGDESNVYGASDHAVSERQTADLSCMGIGVFNDGKLYLHRDLIWKRMGSKEAVEQMLRMLRIHKPLIWWAEKGHISKSIGPFLQDRMMEEKVFANITEVVPVKDKKTRAQSIQAMMAMGLVYFPNNCDWVNRARHEMLLFPNGRHDDFVDFLAHLGRGIALMTGGEKRRTGMTEKLGGVWRPTMEWARKSHDDKKRRLQRMIEND